ncbi:MAG: hypothetical protein WBA12_09700 [Catalinimonas sp.]
MNTEIKFRTLIQHLLNKTKSQALTWEEGSLHDSLVLFLKKETVIIYSGLREDDHEKLKPYYELKIMNDHGDVVGNYRSMKDEGPYQIMKSLYEAARHSCFDIDSTLDNLIEEVAG